MTWKKRYAANVRYEELQTLGPFKLSDDEPENLGKGKFRVRLIDSQGQNYTMSTYEATIGDIIVASGDGFCEAYPEQVEDKTYMRFKSVKVE